jgi:RNA polymerase subunit RPABC4/transcription elongation factor Spt4
MKDAKTEKTRICPKCGQPFTAHPALSREDNETLICPDCGTREALESIGVEKKEQDSIIATIHRCYGER